MAMQLLKFIKAKDEKEVWINPDQIIYAEIVKMAEPTKNPSGTLLHLTGKEGKIWVKETPDTINRVLRKFQKREWKIVEAPDTGDLK